MGFLINDAILLSLGKTARRKGPSDERDFEGRPEACSDKPLTHYCAFAMYTSKASSKGIGFTKWPMFSVCTESPEPSGTSVRVAALQC